MFLETAIEHGTSETLPGLARSRMFLPYGTDAPSVRAPIGTFSLIAVNVLLFATQDLVVPRSIYTLEHDTINPVQWIWSAFAHADACHLIGNMIFLFSFGIAVESALRTWRFLAAYLLTAIIQCAIEQLLAVAMGGSCGASLGASSAIYGIMMIGLLCVPGCNIKCFYLVNFSVWFSWGTVEIPVMIFALFYVFWDLGNVLFSNLGVGTGILHVMGAAVGFVVGIVIYRMGWFESDGNDLVSLIREAWFGSEVDRRTERESLADQVKAEAQKGLPQKIAQLDKYLLQGGLQISLDTIKQIRSSLPDFQATEKQVIRIINLATRREEFDCAMFWIDEYLRRFDGISDLVRLKRARLLVVAYESPQQALREIREIDRQRLNLAQQKIYRQLVAKSNRLKKQMLQEGDFEIRRSEFDRCDERHAPIQGSVSGDGYEPDLRVV